MFDISVWRSVFAERPWLMAICALLAGRLAAAPVAGALCRRFGKRKLKRLPWYFDALACIQFAAFAFAFGRGPQGTWTFNIRSVTTIVLLSSVFWLVVAVWRFWRDRAQFTLASLCLVMLAVALICSAASYVPVVPLVVFLTCPAMTWATYGRRGATEASPPDGAGRAIWLDLLAWGFDGFAGLCMLALFAVLMVVLATRK